MHSLVSSHFPASSSVVLRVPHVTFCTNRSNQWFEFFYAVLDRMARHVVEKDKDPEPVCQRLSTLDMWSGKVTEITLTELGLGVSFSELGRAMCDLHAHICSKCGKRKRGEREEGREKGVHQQKEKFI